jgi:hypothetical protein
VRVYTQGSADCRKEMLFVQLREALDRFMLDSTGDFPQLRYRHSLQLIVCVLHDWNPPSRPVQVLVSMGMQNLWGDYRTFCLKPGVKCYSFGMWMVFLKCMRPENKWTPAFVQADVRKSGDDCPS